VPFAQAVVLTLAILRHNLPQALVAELWGISQPTVSRIYQTLRRVLGAVAQAGAVSLADVEPDEQVLLDGCLLPVGERRGHQELFSGKRHAAGVNVHVAADRAGRLLEVFGPVAGSMHDARAFDVLGLGCACSRADRRRPRVPGLRAGHPGAQAAWRRVVATAAGGQSGTQPGAGRGGAHDRAAEAVEGPLNGVSGPVVGVPGSDPDRGRLREVPHLRKRF
jgi:hypothetical protein